MMMMMMMMMIDDDDEYDDDDDDDDVDDDDDADVPPIQGMHRIGPPTHSLISTVKHNLDFQPSRGPNSLFLQIRVTWNRRT